MQYFDIAQPKEEHLFYAKGRGSKAKGYYSSSGFTVLKGSLVASDSVPSLHWTEKREKMMKEYGELNNAHYVLTSDLTFPVLVLLQCFVLEDLQMVGMNGKIKRVTHWILFIENN